MAQLLWKILWWFLKESFMELPYDPIIPLLKIYPRELKTRAQTKTYTAMFIAA